MKLQGLTERQRYSIEFGIVSTLWCIAIFCIVWNATSSPNLSNNVTLSTVIEDEKVFEEQADISRRVRAIVVRIRGMSLDREQAPLIIDIRGDIRKIEYIYIEKSNDPKFYFCKIWAKSLYTLLELREDLGAKQRSLKLINENLEECNAGLDSRKIQFPNEN